MKHRARWAFTLLALTACEAEDIWHKPRASLERMQEQLSYRPYARNEAFADGRAMRPAPMGSVPYEPQPAATNTPLERHHLEEGRTLFDTFCAVCHGILGEGDTVVADHMRQVKPTRLSSEHVRSQRDEHLQRTIERGYGMMAGFSDRLSPAQSRNIVAYVRALQLSQNIHVSEVPQTLQQRLAASDPQGGQP